MSDKEEKIPQIRFKDFDDAWKPRKMGSLLKEVKRPIKIEDDKDYQLVTVKRRNGGVTSRGIFKGKDILVKNYFELKQGDYLISKRQVVHGANGFVTKYLDGAVVSNEYLVSVGNENITTDFLTIISHLPQMYKMFFLSSYGIDIEKLVFNVEDWKKRTILIPTNLEQDMITNFFVLLDKIITLHQNKYDLICKVKQSYLQKMFLKNGEKVPEIRFGGFTKDWESCSLKKLLIKNSKKNKGLTIENVESISNKTGFTKQTIQFENYSVASDNLSNYYIIDEEMFAYNPSRINVGSIAYKEKDEDSSIVSPLYVSFSTNDKIEDSFLWFWFKTALFEQQRQRLAEGGVRDTLSFNQLILMNMLIPQREEQKKIGIFFKQLDETIAVQKNELDQLKSMKAAFLQKVFI